MNNVTRLCVLSYRFGIASYPVSIIAFVLMLFSSLGREPSLRTPFFILFIVMLSAAALLAIAGIVMGVIGVKQNGSEKQKAKSGIILSTVKLLMSICAYTVIMVYPNVLVGVIL